MSARGLEMRATARMQGERFRAFIWHGDDSFEDISAGEEVQVSAPDGTVTIFRPARDGTFPSACEALEYALAVIDARFMWRDLARDESLGLARYRRESGR